MNKENIKKVVLAYSGGLDTSIIIPWLKENYNNCEVIAVAGNVGQADELDGLEEKAIKTGASKLIVADLTDEMVDDVIIPSLKMGAKYETYLLGTAFARPIIGKKLAEIAVAEGADAICHGCTGKGNDQLGSAGLQGLLFQAIQLGSLAHVAGHGNDFRIVVVLLQPGDDDGSIQTAGIGQDDLLDVIFIHDYTTSVGLFFGMQWIIHQIRVFVNVDCIFIHIL